MDVTSDSTSAPIPRPGVDLCDTERVTATINGYHIGEVVGDLVYLLYNINDAPDDTWIKAVGYADVVPVGRLERHIVNPEVDNGLPRHLTQNEPNIVGSDAYELPLRHKPVIVLGDTISNITNKRPDADVYREIHVVVDLANP